MGRGGEVTGAKRRSLHVIMVGGGDDLRTQLARRLDAADEVVRCRSGTDALARLRAGTLPDVILLAPVLPDMDSVQFRNAQRREPGAADIPLVVLSDASALDSLQRIREERERSHAVARAFAAADTQRLEVVDIHDVLESSLQLAAQEVHTGAHLVRSYQDVPRLRANPARLGQLLLNLLLDAVYAIRADGGHNHVIRVATSFRDGEVEVEVTHSVRARAVAEPLSTATHELLAQVGARLQSCAGEGVTFRISLPAHTRASFPAPPPRSPQRVSSGRPAVLVVDDEPLMCELLSTQLSDYYDVAAYDSSVAALAALLEGEFAAVVCDVMMPELTGLELYERAVRERPELRDRFVFITGGAFSERLRLFMRQTGRPSLRKPCSSSELLAQVQLVAAGARYAQ